MNALLVRNLRDPRLYGLAAALVLVALTFVVPPLALTRQGAAVLAVVDITGSMNVRDYRDGTRPVSRLETAKSALRGFVGGLPCGSRVALGLFSERRAFLLFEPVEVCADFTPLDGALAALDWRMAWEGDSRVASGLYRSIAMAGELGTDLLFLTDGQEAPPLPSTGGPPFEGKSGEVRGAIVGVGGSDLSPIPRFDDRGRETGFYGATDVQQENRFGPPPPDAESREGYNPRNAPFGGAAATGNEHLSSLRESYLQRLAEGTGLTYARLDGPNGLPAAAREALTPRPLPGSLDLRPFLGGAALLLLLAVLAVPLLAPLFRGAETSVNPA